MHTYTATIGIFPGGKGSVLHAGRLTACYS